MRISKVWPVVTLAAMGLAMAPSPASAGGSVFEFGRDSYLPGDRAVGVSMNVSIRQRSAAKPEDGPFFASLVRTAGKLDPFHGAASDFARRVPVGPVSFTKTRPGFVTARIAFRVPHVPHGTYGIELCNRPCTDQWVGDLVGGWFFIGTPLEYEVLQLRGRVAEQRRQLHVREHRLAGLLGELHGLRVVHRTTDEGLAGIERRLASLRSDDRGASPWPVVGWAVAALFALLLAVQWGGRRGISSSPRLRDGSPHPDFEEAKR